MGRTARDGRSAARALCQWESPTQAASAFQAGPDRQPWARLRRRRPTEERAHYPPPPASARARGPRRRPARPELNRAKDCFEVPEIRDQVSRGRFAGVRQRSQRRRRGISRGLRRRPRKLLGNEAFRNRSSRDYGRRQWRQADRAEIRCRPEDDSGRDQGAGRGSTSGIRRRRLVHGRAEVGAENLTFSAAETVAPVTVRESNTLNTSIGPPSLVPVLINPASCKGATVGPE